MNDFLQTIQTDTDTSSTKSSALPVGEANSSLAEFNQNITSSNDDSIFLQNKLTKAEWESIEKPVSEDEKKILHVILEGYQTINIRFNENQTMIQILNIIPSNEIQMYLYKEYFLSTIEQIADKINVLMTHKTKQAKKEKTKIDTTIDQEMIDFIKNSLQKINPQKMDSEIKKIKKIDMFRIKNMNETIHIKKPNIFEFLLLEFCEKIVLSLVNKNNEYGFYLYSLIQLKKVSIQNINLFVSNFIDQIIELTRNKMNIAEIFHRSPEFIEKNKYLLKYADISLFSHQKQLFSCFKLNKQTPKLVLYMAPTGTGKTLSPIGLATTYRIIFVCVARHVGLALAKSAISIGKKVAFAFGCETASEIRLHYFSAVSYSIHRKSGGIFKVDNSVGTNVEIMICDVKSYLTAMHYMLAFNPEEDIITYWDEPTITMDYENHELHETIHKNWVENRISKVVLSCATLPKESEIIDTIMDFKSKFENAEIETITSFDCKKSISLLNKEGKCSLPHLLFSDYDELINCIKYCEENKTLLRYFDLEETVRFLEYVNQNDFLDEKYKMNQYFHKIEDITMDSIKIYYIEAIKVLQKNVWPMIHSKCVETQEYKFKHVVQKDLDVFRKIKSVDSSLISPHHNNMEFNRTTSVCPDPMVIAPTANPFQGILLTTNDAHTLTDGPTIFLVEDVEKIGKFYIQQTKIPEKVLNSIMEKIGENEVVQKKISILEKSLEDKLGNEIEKDKKMEKEHFNKETREIMNQLKTLQEYIKSVNMESKYIPNTIQHQLLWVPNGEIVNNAFVPVIDEMVIKEIMSVDVENQLKLLLLLGIGVFTKQPNIQYMEIMKRLASEQKLYIIIAQSDYIYGTNYQFCHGFIGKDLMNMTHQKTIQALGRIGRNNIQQEYTVRFRDDSIIKNLFRPMGENFEAINMSKLFNS
jgi:hypothetical protein